MLRGVPCRQAIFYPINIIIIYIIAGVRLRPSGRGRTPAIQSPWCGCSAPWPRPSELVSSQLTPGEAGITVLIREEASVPLAARVRVF